MKIHNLVNPLYWLEFFTFYGGGKGRGGFSDIRNVRTTDAAEPVVPPPPVIVDPIEDMGTGGEPTSVSLPPPSPVIGYPVAPSQQPQQQQQQSNPFAALQQYSNALRGVPQTPFVNSPMQMGVGSYNMPVMRGYGMSRMGGFGMSPMMGGYGMMPMMGYGGYGMPFGGGGLMSLFGAYR